MDFSNPLLSCPKKSSQLLTLLPADKYMYIGMCLCVCVSGMSQTEEENADINMIVYQEVSGHSNYILFVDDKIFHLKNPWQEAKVTKSAKISVLSI